MIIEGRDITTLLHETADVCIIGSGCGGAACARTLAQAGRKVIVLEEGGSYGAADFDGTEETAYQRLYQQRGAQATSDLAVTVLQGRCVGGSSTINWGTTLRTPEFVLDAWARAFGVRGMSMKEMEPYFERIERYLNVQAEPEDRHSPNNRILLDGCRALGHRVRANGRNVRGCVQAGACGLGCPFDAKLSANITYIPDAVAHGAMVYADCRAETIAVHGPRKRVTGNVLDRQTRRPRLEFTIDAPVIIVAASAIQSPVLLLKSGLANASGQVGKNLTFHLTTAVMGIFDRVIYGAGGIPQSVMCDEFMNRNGEAGGFWIESVPIYPALAALALPGFGPHHREAMRGFKNIGASIVLVKESDSSGSVAVNDNGRAVISYTSGPLDRLTLRQALKEAARIHFAAGAREVKTLHTRAAEIGSPDDIDRVLDAARWGPNDLALYSAHPLGTCRMGEDPLRSVVDSHCQSHDVRGLFVIDGSVTPTCLGVNPQLTILAVAEKSAEWVAENFRKLSS